MILLTSTTDLIQVVSSAAAALDVHTSYMDNNSLTAAVTPGRTNTSITTATTTTVVPTPSTNIQRNVKYMSFNNKDASLSDTLTIQHTDGTNTENLFKITLAPGERLIYVDGDGWSYYNALGQLVTSGQSVGGSNAASSASPTGAVSTTEKAMGLGSSFTYTPKSTGNIIVAIAGVALNADATVGAGTTITGRFGTGTAPINGATTGLGTSFGLPQHFVSSTAAGQAGWMVLGKVTGQALNTPLWFDVSLLGVSTGTSATVKDVQFVCFEVP